MCRCVLRAVYWGRLIIGSGFPRPPRLSALCVHAAAAPSGHLSLSPSFSLPRSLRARCVRYAAFSLDRTGLIACVPPPSFVPFFFRFFFLRYFGPATTLLSSCLSRISTERTAYRSACAEPRGAERRESDPPDGARTTTRPRESFVVRTVFFFSPLSWEESRWMDCSLRRAAGEGRRSWPAAAVWMWECEKLLFN